MIIKAPKNWKDLIEGPVHHAPNSRRDFLKGLSIVTLSLGLPDFLINPNNRAYAATLTCPTPTLNTGAIAQVFSEGGPTMGARFISEAQAAVMNATMAANYGISGQANLQKLGPNMVVDKTSAFGFALLQGPPGYAGGAAAWQTNVLSKISGGGHLGPFNQDDGAGQNTGLLGGVGTLKKSQMGKDLKIGLKNTLATWANGLPAAAVTAASPAALAKTFSLTPAATGLTNATELANATDTANTIARSLDSVLGTSTRKGGTEFVTNAGCALNSNVSLADPNYGTALFTPANIAALTSKLTVANLTASEQGHLAAYFQAAVGVAGGVVTQFGGRDYHGTDPNTNIGPKDLEEARALVMFLAACDAAQSRGAWIYLANGQAIANGTGTFNTTINGTAVTITAPSAQGDAGGSYNAGLIVFYDPKGAPPAAKFTGTITATSGNAKTDPNVGSSQEAVAGLYLSALSWINNGSVPQAALTKMQTAGVAKTPGNIILI